MTSHLSERFHDQERREIYLDLIQSGLDGQMGCEQAWVLDHVASTEVRPARPWKPLPRLSLRWFALPVPFLTWAGS